MKTHAVSATEFKAKLFRYLDEIEQNGGSITITRRGRPWQFYSGQRKSPGNLLATVGPGRFESLAIS
jgi:Antitoxin Phd_YefM, type II toxin-antitoxin system